MAAVGPMSAQAAPQQQANCSQYYAVVRGDTYWGISQKFGLSVSELQAANGNSPLYAGTSICIPGGSVPMPSPVPVAPNQSSTTNGQSQQSNTATAVVNGATIQVTPAAPGGVVNTGVIVLVPVVTTPTPTIYTTKKTCVEWTWWWCSKENTELVPELAPMPPARWLPTPTGYDPSTKTWLFAGTSIVGLASVSVATLGPEAVAASIGGCLATLTVCGVVIVAVAAVGTGYLVYYSYTAITTSMAAETVDNELDEYPTIYPKGTGSPEANGAHFKKVFSAVLIFYTACRANTRWFGVWMKDPPQNINNWFQIFQKNADCTRGPTKQEWESGIRELLKWAVSLPQEVIDALTTMLGWW